MSQGYDFGKLADILGPSPEALKEAQDENERLRALVGDYAARLRRLDAYFEGRNGPVKLSEVRALIRGNT